jgi:hypothetical protein
MPQQSIDETVQAGESVCLVLSRPDGSTEKDHSDVRTLRVGDDLDQPVQMVNTVLQGILPAGSRVRLKDGTLVQLQEETIVQAHFRAGVDDRARHGTGERG